MTTRYSIKAPLPPAERKARIAAALEAPVDSMAVPYREGFRTVPVARLPLDLPVYRANNGRLAVVEGAHIHRHGLPADHFETGEDTAEVQALLHGFLAELSQHEEGPVRQALARAARQVEPILVTADGVVVNGNRRLSAMRELHAEDPGKYGVFSEVDCGVLPGETTAADLEVIEAALQLAPETKLAYGWVERRLKMRRQRDVVGLATSDIVATYQLLDEDHLDRELEELALAERYLRDFQGALDYETIADREEAFRQMHANLAPLPEPQRHTWEAAGFALLHAAQQDPERTPTDAFPFAPARPPYGPAVTLHRLGAELGLWEPRETRDSFTPPPPPELAALRERLMRRDEAPRHADLLARIFRAVQEEHREQPDPQLLLRQLENVVRLAARIDGAAYTPQQRRRIADQLGRLAALAGDVSPARPAPAGSAMARLRKLVRRR